MPCATHDIKTTPFFLYIIKSHLSFSNMELMGRPSIHMNYTQNTPGVWNSPTNKKLPYITITSKAFGRPSIHMNYTQNTPRVWNSPTNKKLPYITITSKAFN